MVTKDDKTDDGRERKDSFSLLTLKNTRKAWIKLVIFCFFCFWVWKMLGDCFFPFTLKRLSYQLLLVDDHIKSERNV